MFSKFLTFGAIVGLSVAFTACSRPIFKVTELTPEANRVAVSPFKPRDNCKILSEKEGVANVYQVQYKRVSANVAGSSDSPFTAGGATSTKTNSDGSMMMQSEPKKTRASKDELVESAKNDLLNKAALFEAPRGKKIVVYYGDEKWSCGSQTTCFNARGELKINQVTSLRIPAEIYECGL